MTELNPPLHLQNRTDHSAQGDRLLIRSLYRNGGVAQYNDLLVAAQASPNMTVQIGSGVALIPGTENAWQGTYHCVNDGSINKPIAASDVSLPRMDIVVGRIKDQFYSGVDNQWELAVVTGTPNASPSQPAIPANAIVIATVAVAAGATSIVSANITNLQFTTGPAKLSVSRFQALHANDLFQFRGPSGTLIAELDQTGHFKSLGVTGGPTKARRPMCRVENGTYNVPNLTTQKLPFAAVGITFDTDGMFSDANDWIVIQTAGIYTIRATIAFTWTNTVGYRAIGLVRNNVTEVVKNSTVPAASNPSPVDCAVELTTPCNPGDTFFARAWQNSGASLAIFSGAGYDGMTLQAMWRAPLT